MSWFTILFNKKKITSIEEIKEKVGYIFFAYAKKGHRRKILLPENFNLDEHIAQYPPERHGFINGKSREGLKFTKDKIFYFLGLLSSIPARNTDLINEDGFVPIIMSRLQKNIRDIISYKDYLVNTRVLVCNPYYIPKKRSRRYKWTNTYIESKFVLKEVICSHEEDIYFMQEESVEQNAEYLFHWYKQNKLNINPVASDYAYKIREVLMENKEDWDVNNSTFEVQNPLLRYQSAMLNIGKIGNNDYQPHIDKTVFRLHSVITNLQKDYRNFINYENQNLVCIDIKNCQPYLSYLLFNPDFWTRNSSLPLNFYSLPLNVQKLFIPIPRLLIEIQDFLNSTDQNSFNEYKELVSSGRIYERIIEVCSNELNRVITRKEAKTLMFYILFSSNRGQSNDYLMNQMKKIFNSSLYPNIAELFRIIKKEYTSINQEKQHNRLSILSQSIESSIILHKCCKRIWEEGNHQIPVFTIHDSIATTSEYAEYVKTVMKEELEYYIGISPSLDTEEWDVAKLKYQDIYHNITQE